VESFDELGFDPAFVDRFEEGRISDDGEFEEFEGTSFVLELVLQHMFLDDLAEPVVEFFRSNLIKQDGSRGTVQIGRFCQKFKRLN
jgi:hypothetical protein